MLTICKRHFQGFRQQREVLKQNGDISNQQAKNFCLIEKKSLQKTVVLIDNISTFESFLKLHHL